MFSYPLLKSNSIYHTVSFNLACKRQEMALRLSLPLQYSSNTLRTYIVGALGENAYYEILHEWFPFCRKELYFLNIHHEHKYIGDIRIGNIYMEVKTRTDKDFDIYGNRIRDTCVRKLRNRNKLGIHIVIVFMSLDNDDFGHVRGFNFIEDYYNNKYIERGLQPYIIAGRIRSTYNLYSLIKQCLSCAF